MPEDDAKGGRGPRRRNRKSKKGKGSSSGDALGAASGPQTGNGNTNNTNQPASNSGGRGRRPRSGGGRGRVGGGGGGTSESRYKPSASSPLQLPHVKVTLRNIMSDGNTKNTSINDIVSSVRTFLDGTFPSSKVAGDGTVETDAYMLAWQAEKEEFDGAKAMFIEASAASSAANNSNSTTTSSRPFSSGWVYEEKPSTLPSNRESLLPTTQTIVSNLMSNETDKKISDTTNINWVVDTAMNQMMQECGKSYLHYVGGKIVLDGESMIDVGLAERVVSEKEKLAKAKKKLEDEAKAEAAFVNDNEDGEVEPQSAEDKPSDSKSFDVKEVEKVTKGIEQLSTATESKSATKKQIQNNIPAIRIRILSVTPIKQSKRRGEIGGKVTLALYPPDPCLLFKEACRDAGKMAGDLQFEKQKAKTETDKVANEKEGEEAKNEEVVAASEPTAEEDNGEAKEGEKGEVSAESKNEEDTTSPSPVVTKITQPQPPQIPYYPLLSPAERSRAVARSRVLIHRTIEAMKIHAVSSGAPQSNEGKWEVLESSSQKTWKSRPHAMVESLMEGKELSELVVEHDESTAGDTGVKKGRGKGGFVDRNDRLESTIEKSEDYKAFIESLESGGALPTTKEAASNKDDKKKKKSSSYTVPVEKPPEVDEEGRPLSAIVVHMRAKQAVIDKANAEAKAKADKAKAAAKKAKDKARKEKKKAKRKEASKKKRGDKGGKSSASSSAPLNLSGPPPGATLLKKGSVPASGFGG